MWLSSQQNTPLVDAFDGEGRQVVGRYPTYSEAENAVDRLAEESFPVEHAEIVGRDLALVERITGRMGPGRAAWAGAGTGAWFGLFIGVLVGLFTPGPAWLGLMLGGLLIGALWGAAFGLAAHWTMHARHDFASARALAAGSYELAVEDAYVEQARLALAAQS